MVSLLAYAAGGALSGLGQGLVKKGESEQEQRKALALENARRESATALETQRQKGEIALQTQRDTAAASRQTSEQTFTRQQSQSGAAAAAAAAEAQFQRDKALEYIRGDIARAKAEGDFTRARDLANLSMQGVESIQQTADGTFFAVMKNGTVRSLSDPSGQMMKGVPPTPKGGSDPYPGLSLPGRAAPASTSPPRSNRPPLGSFAQ